MSKISINMKQGSIKKEPPIVGIDLGTTNSLIAYIKNGEAVAIKDSNGLHTLTPSVIHFNDSGEIKVGASAKSQLITAPENTIYSVKRLMGKSYKDVNDLGFKLSYRIIDTQDDDTLVKVLIGEKSYTPIELSAEILKNLKSKAEHELGQEIDRAVITVPAYFNDAQRQATRDAGKLAGLDVLRIVNEPTAASLAYGIGQTKDESKTIAVYDLGGGTFDISILQIEGGIFEVLSTNGNTSLGGDDIDNVIVEHWLTELKIEQSHLDANAQLSQEFRLMAESAKKHLSSHNSFQNTINDYDLRLSLEKFNQLIDPLIQKTLKSCHKALMDAEMTIEKIDEVVMVGGSTRIPAIKNMVSDFFKRTVHDKLNPDEVVALGAAIQADILAGNRKDMLLLDVTPLSLGIETVGGLMDTLLPRNSKIPSKVGRQYTTSIDGQKNLKVSVFQGERDLVADNRKLGEFILKDIPPMPAGIPKIEIQFLIDADGILKVKAKELRSNVETEVEIKSTYGISEDEMGRMLRESIINAEQDMAQRVVLEAINEGNNVLHATDKFIKQNESILSEIELVKTKELAHDLSQSIAAKDKDQINKALENLNHYTTPLAHRALDHNIGKSLKGEVI